MAGEPQTGNFSPACLPEHIGKFFKPSSGYEGVAERDLKGIENQGGAQDGEKVGSIRDDDDDNDDDDGTDDGDNDEQQAAAVTKSRRRSITPPPLMTSIASGSREDLVNSPSSPPSRAPRAVPRRRSSVHLESLSDGIDTGPSALPKNFKKRHTPARGGGLPPPRVSPRRPTSAVVQDGGANNAADDDQSRGRNPGVASLPSSQNMPSGDPPLLPSAVSTSGHVPWAQTAGRKQLLADIRRGYDREHGQKDRNSC